jgi:hypothetical protein
LIKRHFEDEAKLLKVFDEVWGPHHVIYVRKISGYSGATTPPIVVALCDNFFLARRGLATLLGFSFFHVLVSFTMDFSICAPKNKQKILLQ